MNPTGRIFRMPTPVAVAAGVIAVSLRFAFGSTPQTSTPIVVEVDMTGIIEPVTAEYVVRGIDYANRIHAQAVLLELSTPGGLETSMRQMVKAVISSHVPVITYVAPSGSRAASAGFFVLLSGDLAIMSPGTNTGAAHPVLLNGGDIGKTEGTKVLNDAAAFIRSIAQKRGRNVQLAEAGVRESKSYTDNEALDHHLIDAIATRPEDIFNQFDDKSVERFDGSTTVLHLKGAHIVKYDMTARERFLAHLADPNIAFILGALGALGLYVEFTHPGMVLPGVGGAIAMVLALYGFHMLPINYLGAVLIFLAFVLFALEVKVTSHGILAAGGVVAMVVGSMILIDSPWPGAHIHLSTSLSVALPAAAICVILLRAVVEANRRKSLTGAEGLVNSTGVARTDLAPFGKVLVHGEIWDARAAASLRAGDRIRVREVDGLTLVVDPELEATSGKA
jgi:membrane-bound serine protease (ClpP class)